MKTCPNCNAEIEDSFEICWNCNYSTTENKIIDFIDEQAVNKKDINCLRCDVKLLYSGNYHFHEGTRYGLLGNLFELFVNKESFDIYVCPKCGKVEFYVP
jgi:Zn finger protein HypA/HybF involved in hydrogenase expression